MGRRMDSWIYLVIVGIPLILLSIAAIADAFQRPDLGWGKRIGWTAAVILLPYLGVIIYFAARPPNPPEGKRYDEEEPRAAAIVDTLEQLHAQHAAGTLSDEAYLEAKRQALGASTAPEG